MRRSFLVLIPLMSGCWKTELVPLAGDVVHFDPQVGGPTDWVISELDLGLACPDGQSSAVFVVHPSSAPSSPLPVAVVYHSGPFDYVLEPNEVDPLAGPHLHEPSRLSRSWAVRRAFNALGMYPNDDPVEKGRGALASALVQSDVVLVLPTNCWGDHWHNADGNNATEVDFFDRNGRGAAIRAWRMATEPAFAAAEGLDLPVQVDPDRAYAVGLGEGGRAVGELLYTGHSPTAVLADSVADDLRTYWDDIQLYEDEIAGLERLFPEGEDQTRAGALGWTTTWPRRIVYIYSSLDTRIPVHAHDHVRQRLADVPEAWVVDVGTTAHVPTGVKRGLALKATAFLLNQESPDTGLSDSGL